MHRSHASIRYGVFLLILLAPRAAGAAGYTVTSTEDTPGFGSLRQAIIDANAGGVPTTISFNFAIGCPVNCQIALSSSLPVITVPVTIDGYTQPGASPNTQPFGNNNAVIKVVLNANYQMGGGLQFGPTATNSVVRGLNIVNFDTTGIDIQANGVAVEGNRIGLDGMPSSGFGILILGAAGNVRVGGTTPAQVNALGWSVTVETSGDGTLIEGNELQGVVVRTSGANVGSVTIGGVAAGAGNYFVEFGVTAVANSGFSVGALTIQGNSIGVSADRTHGQGTQSGIYIAADPGGSFAPSLIGGNTAAARNVIGGGIYATGGISGLAIQGNYIGCNGTATAVIIAHLDWAVNVEGGATFGGSVAIGGPGPGEGNVLTAGTLGGVRIALTTATVEGNFIGIAPDGKTPLSNGIGVLVDSADATIGGPALGIHNVIADNYSDGVRVDISMSAIRNAAKATVNGNSIYKNGGLGIYFAGTGQVPLPNDPGDGDTGPNGLQNYPTMTAASISGGQVHLSGTLDSAPNTLCRIEWFANTACDPSGYGEGRLTLGNGLYMTDGSGHASFSGVMRPIPIGYSIITATATDPAGNTSEFSSCFAAAGPAASFHTVPPCRLSDTRGADGPYGGPSFFPGQQRSYVVAGQCGVPSNAVSVALNVAVTAPSGAGNLVLFAGEAARPATSTINYGIGRTKSDDAIVPLGPNGDLSVFANQAVGRVDVIIDVTGYFQ